VKLFSIQSRATGGLLQQAGPGSSHIQAALTHHRALAPHEPLQARAGRQAQPGLQGGHGDRGQVRRQDGRCIWDGTERQLGSAGRYMGRASAQRVALGGMVSP
jgi:hypothetical protein